MGGETNRVVGDFIRRFPNLHAVAGPVIAGLEGTAYTSMGVVLWLWASDDSRAPKAYFADTIEQAVAEARNELDNELDAEAHDKLLRDNPQYRQLYGKKDEAGAAR